MEMTCWTALKVNEFTWNRLILFMWLLSHICSMSHRFIAFSVCKNIQVLSVDSIKLVHSVFTLMCFVVWVLPKWDTHQIHAVKYQISLKSSLNDRELNVCFLIMSWLSRDIIIIVLFKEHRWTGTHLWITVWSVVVYCILPQTSRWPQIKPLTMKIWFAWF